jgi:Xaa-Pro aminopeptidase
MADAALSTMARHDGSGVDFASLRAARRQRLLDAMRDASLDVLVLGRPANVTYASGARLLWTAGSRPFGPGAVVVAATGRTHLMQTWDEGVPPDLVGHDELYGLRWNPANLLASLAAIPGLADARRLGTDSLAPGFELLVGALAPDAEIVDATPAIRSARGVKLPAEQTCIATATALAEAGLSAMIDALHPGITERQLLGVLLERLASLGVPTPPTEGVVSIGSPLRRIPTERAVATGDVVVLDPGAMFAGYEGGVGRTWVVGDATDRHRGAAARTAAVLAAVVGACRAGATGAQLVAAWRSTGEALPPFPIAHGVGLGMEEPVIGDGIGEAEVLVADSVLSVTAWVDGHLERDLVLVGERGSETISRYGHGPAGGSAA